MRCWSKGTVSYEHFGRLNRPAFERASNNAIGIKYKKQAKKIQTETYAEAEAKYYPGTKGKQISVPELYYMKKNLLEKSKN